jgi:uncharacterized membrane protein YccC
MSSNTDYRLLARREWKRLTRLGPFRWNLVTPWRAARAATGVVLPLVVGWATGHIQFGAYAALGALPAGVASFQGESRTRVAAVLVSSIGMALSTFVGATVARSPWLLVPIIFVWSYAAGLAVCLGPWASIAGGLFQAILVALAWTVRAGWKERQALAETFRGLAAYASDLAAGKLDPPSSTAFPASSALDDPNPFLPQVTRLMLVDLLEQAERIRASLAALGAQAGSFGSSDDPSLRVLIEDASAALTSVAEALVGSRRERIVSLTQLRKRLVHQSVTPAAAWRWSGEGLLGQLRSVGRTVGTLENVKPQPLATDAASLPLPTPLQSIGRTILTTLRANLTTSTEAGRHALRLAVVATLAETVVQTAGLYQGRWATLTIFMVLKPDYASTVYRGVQRAFGTAVGAALAAAAEVFNPGGGWAGGARGSIRTKRDEAGDLSARDSCGQGQ